VFQSNYNNYEVVVVDNDSSDGSFEKALSHFSRAHFIKNSANIGFSQGNNIGIRFALEKFADAIFILNNDTIIEKDTIAKLASEAQRNSTAGIISPIIMNPDKSTWFAGGTIDWMKMRTNHLFQIISNKPYASQYLSGCAMLIKKDVFKKIGLFDERYFLYYEDADFSFRTKAAGFELIVEPSARIVHLEQSTSKNSSKTYWLVLSGLIFFFTHATPLQKLWLYPYVTARKMKNLYDVLFRRSTFSRDIRKAFGDYLLTKRVR